VAVVEQAVEEGGGDDVIAEDSAPLRHRLVGGDEGARAFVALGDELEQQVCAPAFEGEVAELIEDEQLGHGEKEELLGKAGVGLGLGQRRDERRGTDGKHRVAGLDCSAAEGDGQMRLADARGPKTSTFSAPAT
jgi:hypothetical protein